MSRAKLRLTRVRQEIFDLLSQADRPLSIQELVSASNRGHFVSIYRSIDAMHRAGIVKLVPQGFKNFFELSDTYKPHHHHATCEKCGSSLEIHSPELEKLMKQLALEAGLKPTKHQFELFGVCEACADKG